MARGIPSAVGFATEQRQAKTAGDLESVSDRWQASSYGGLPFGGVERAVPLATTLPTHPRQVLSMYLLGGHELVMTLVHDVDLVALNE